MERQEAEPDSALVAPPTGYAPITHASVLPTILGLKHVRLDPSICVEGGCMRDDVSVVEAECVGHLEADVEVALRTEDGAVQATLAGYLLQGLPGESFEDPGGSMWVDLADVSGRSDTHRLGESCGGLLPPKERCRRPNWIRRAQAVAVGGS